MMKLLRCCHEVNKSIFYSLRLFTFKGFWKGLKSWLPIIGIIVAWLVYCVFAMAVGYWVAHAYLTPEWHSGAPLVSLAFFYALFAYLFTVHETCKKNDMV